MKNTKRIYTLANCSTCIGIINQLNAPADVEIINIKETNIDPATLDWIKDKVGSYEALFSKRAMKYRGLGLHEMQLSENDYRKYMLEEYTFLKRPFIMHNDSVFIGNAKSDVAKAVAYFNSL